MFGIPTAMNILTQIGNDFKAADLSKLDWINSPSVGLQLKAEALPPNIGVLGQPLLAGNHYAALSPTLGQLAYYRDTIDKPVFACYPRIVLGTQTIQVNSLTKIPLLDAGIIKQSIGWQGTIKISGNDYPYSFKQWGTPNHDIFGVQVAFTSPVTLSAFSYEYVFLLSSKVNGVRFYEHPPHSITVKDYPLVLKQSIDFGSNSTPQVTFLSDKTALGRFDFGDLAKKAQSSYWKIEKIGGQLVLVIGFRFPGLAAGEQFENDGYIGPADNSLSDEYPDYVIATRVQNTVGTGTLTELGLLSNDTTPTGNVRLGVYADTGSKPVARLLDAGAVAFAANGSWATISSLSLAVVLNLYYWLAFDMASENRTGANSSGGCSWGASTYGALPATCPVTDYNTYDICMRAYITLGGVAAYIPKIMNII